MRDAYWKLVGLAQLGVAAAYFHVYGGACFIYVNHAARWPGLVEAGGSLTLNPWARLVGYLILVGLGLLVLFADRLEKLRMGDES